MNCYELGTRFTNAITHQRILDVIGDRPFEELIKILEPHNKTYFGISAIELRSNMSIKPQVV